MLVVIDNVADESQVSPLLPGSGTCGVLITGRPRLVGLAGVRHLRLDVLRPAQAIELLARITGPEQVRAAPSEASEIVRLCDHLPLAVRAAGARLASRPDWPLARIADLLRDERRRLDELAAGDLTVRASLGLSYTALSSPARRLYYLLSVLHTPRLRGLGRRGRARHVPGGGRAPPRRAAERQPPHRRGRRHRLASPVTASTT
ncbi:NB-ARC domain-containing protein [Nonomuraea ferruginea]